MSIQQNNKKIKINDFEIPNLSKNAKTWIIILIIILVSIISYFLGRNSVKNDKNYDSSQTANISQYSSNTEQNTLSTSPVEASKNQNMTNLSSGSGSNNTGSIYASPNGSKYYLPWCNGGKSLKSKIYFKTEIEAQSKGYTKSSTCK